MEAAMVAKSLKMSAGDLGRAIARGIAAGIERKQTEASAVTVDRSIDLLAWCRRYLPRYFTDKPSRMHAWMAEKLQAARYQRGTNLNVLGPRGGAKSTIGNTAYILRCAVEGTEPYILILGKTSKMADKQLGHVRRELEENPQLARDYPEACGRGSVWSGSELRLKNGVMIQAFGVGQDIRGARNAADRPTLCVCDDLQDDDAITSNSTREGDWTWLTGTVLNIGDARTNYINLATAIHREAIGHKLMTTPGWESQAFASIIEWPERMDLWAQWAEILHDYGGAVKPETRARAFYEANRAEMDLGAVVLWPDREPLYALMLMRESKGRRAFDREKQVKLAGAEENEWPDEYFSENHIFVDEIPHHYRLKTMALDPSKGRDAKRSDYSAYVMLTIGVDGLLYVDANLERRPTPKMIADGVELYRAFRPDAFGVEANAWQELLGGEFERVFAEQNQLAAAPFQIFNNTNKQVRIRRLGPWLAQGRLKFLASSPGARLLVSQLRDFPDIHSHDDGPDALEMAIRLADEFSGMRTTDHPSHVDN
jgi:predicted phage terminase large subunit-like protein